MNTGKQILVNMLTGWTAIAIRAVIALGMVPFLLTHLGKDGYGLIGLLGVIVSMAGVADLGLRAALGRELSEQVAKGDRNGFNELTSTALMLYLGIAMVLAVAGWILAPWFVRVLKVSQQFHPDAVWLIRLYGSLSVILSFITPVFSAGLSSHHRFDLVNTVQIISGIVSSLALFAVIPFVPQPLYGWVGVMLGFQVLILLLTIFFYRRFCNGAKIGIRFLNFSRLRPLFHLGGYMYVLQMTMALSERSDPLVISAFFGPVGVALYQPGLRLSKMIRPMVRSLADQMYPLTTKEHVSGSQQGMQKILVLGTKYTLMMGILFTAGLLVFSQPFCRLWLGGSIGEDYKIVGLVVAGWALIDLLSFAAGTQWPVLLGMRSLKVLLSIQVPTAILNVFISIWLVGFTPLGVPGVLVATILIGLIRRPILAVYTARQCGLSAQRYFKEAYWTPMICFAATLTGAYGVRLIIPPDSYLSLLCCAGLTALVWGGCCWFVGIGSDERANVLLGIHSLLRKKVSQ